MHDGCEASGHLELAEQKTGCGLLSLGFRLDIS